MTERVKLRRYDHRRKPENQLSVDLTRIVVPSEDAKQQLLAASRYLHDLREIDTHYFMVNTLCHLYMNPDLVVVEPNVDR